MTQLYTRFLPYLLSHPPLNCRKNLLSLGLLITLLAPLSVQGASNREEKRGSGEFDDCSSPHQRTPTFSDDEDTNGTSDFRRLAKEHNQTTPPGEVFAMIQQAVAEAREEEREACKSSCRCSSRSKSEK